MKCKIKDSQLVYEVDQKILAYIDFKKNAQVYSIMEVFVDSSLRGQGVAQQLMDAMVQVLQEQQAQCIAVCPYAIAYFEKHPQFQTVLQQ
ncbi:MAG: GNAT family N-acetyltransferase [Breznakia sp.]